jgi:uncharacterized protein (DUF433 family)
MDWRQRIVLDPQVLTGKPVIKGTRLAVDHIVGLLAQGWTEEQLMKNYPGLGHDDILACLSFATSVLGAERFFPVKA